MADWRYEISLLVLKQYFTHFLHSLVKFFQHSKRNFISPHGDVISSIYLIVMLLKDNDLDHRCDP